MWAVLGGCLGRGFTWIRWLEGWYRYPSRSFSLSDCGDPDRISRSSDLFGSTLAPSSNWLLPSHWILFKALPLSVWPEWSTFVALVFSRCQMQTVTSLNRCFQPLLSSIFLVPISCVSTIVQVLNTDMWSHCSDSFLFIPVAWAYRVFLETFAFPNAALIFALWGSVPAWT